MSSLQAEQPPPSALRQASASPPAIRGFPSAPVPPTVGSSALTRAPAPPPLELEVRQLAAHPEVVVVRIRGTVDEVGAERMATRVGQQLGRAVHVVLDLAEVPVLRCAGVGVLLKLHRAATARGTQLHITGAEQAGVARALQRLHHDRLLCLATSVDAVIALLPHGRIRDRGHCGPDR